MARLANASLIATIPPGHFIAADRAARRLLARLIPARHGQRWPPPPMNIIASVPAAGAVCAVDTVPGIVSGGGRRVAFCDTTA